VEAEREEHRSKRRKLQNSSGEVSSHGRRNVQQDDGVEDMSDEVDEDQELEDFDSDDGEETHQDPFDRHFASIEETSVAAAVQNIAQNGWTNSKRTFGKNGKCTFFAPGDNLLPVPKLEASSPSSLRLKKKLEKVGAEVLCNLGKAEKDLVPYVFGYQDILFGARTVGNAAKLRDMTCLHVLNHLFKTRDRVLKNNARMQKEDADPNVECRDQGFTRPKVLFLLPTRQSCVRVLNSIVDLLQPEQQENRKRFEASFDKADEPVPDDRPDDFKELFEGNDDDMFRLGVKFTRKTMKFFAQFYNSDIIFASPLGLRKGIEGVE
jgi:U3 small nucleolar RNA-associated protein 25